MKQIPAWKSFETSLHAVGMLLKHLQRIAAKFSASLLDLRVCICLPGEGTWSSRVAGAFDCAAAGQGHTSVCSRAQVNRTSDWTHRAAGGGYQTMAHGLEQITKLVPLLSLAPYRCTGEWTDMQPKNVLIDQAVHYSRHFFFPLFVSPFSPLTFHFSVHFTHYIGIGRLHFPVCFRCWHKQ